MVTNFGTKVQLIIGKGGFKCGGGGGGDGIGDNILMIVLIVKHFSTTIVRTGL